MYDKLLSLGQVLLSVLHVSNIELVHQCSYRAHLYTQLTLHAQAASSSSCQTDQHKLAEGLDNS